MSYEIQSAFIDSLVATNYYRNLKGEKEFTIKEAVDDVKLNRLKNFIKYNSTNYIIETKKKDRFFEFNHEGILHWVKVKDGIVTDLYKAYFEYMGKKYRWLQFNPTTLIPESYYKETEVDLDKIDITKFVNETVLECGAEKKYNFADDSLDSTLIFASYDFMTKSFKKYVETLSFKDEIFGWCEKSYGRLVLYKENDFSLEFDKGYDFYNNNVS
jgi:hypothetical protein